MSLASNASTAIDNAVVSLINSGVTTVVAAGNDNADAGDTSPAHVNIAITVGSITIADAKASYSNYGSVLDVWAPGTQRKVIGFRSDLTGVAGTNITSTWIDGKTDSASGTSMATPHVAGFSAYLLGLDSSLTPSSIASTINLKALNGVLSGIRKYCTPAFAQRD